MPLKPTQFIWQDGQLVPWEQAMVHVLTHALHYGSSVFEGIRSYKTPTGPIGFRLTNHIQRMFDSAKIYRLSIPYSINEIVAACIKVLTKNDLGEGAYLRPLAFRGYGEMGVIGDPEKPANCIIAAWNWGTYLGEEALEKGVDVLKDMNPWAMLRSSLDHERYSRMEKPYGKEFDVVAFSEENPDDHLFHFFP